MADGHSHAHSHGHEDSMHRHYDHNHELPSPMVGHEARERGVPSKKDADLAEVAANQRKLKRATAFVLVFFLVEVVGGILSGSLAIISDAAHLLADISGFILAMLANEIASRPACDKLTYGPVRAEVLSALFSTVLILVLSLLLIYSAICRIIEFSHGQGDDIDGRMMSFIAFMGVAVNLVLLGLLGPDHEGHGHDHSHSHAHGGHNDDHDHGLDHHDDDELENGEEEEGLMEQGVAATGGATLSAVGEHSSLFANASLNNGGSPVTAVVNGGAASSGSRNQDLYGSVVLEQGFLEDGKEGGHKERKVSLKKPTKRAKNINMQAAVLHAVTDLVQSSGVLLAGLLIWHDPRWKWADPIATLFFVGMVMNSTRWLLKRGFNVIMEGVPEGIDYDRLRKRLSGINGVTDVHCLHVWSLTLGRTVVSAHIKAMDPESALTAAHEICEDMGVVHSTIQVQVDHCVPESCTHPCVSAVGKCCGPEGGNPAPRSPNAEGTSVPSSRA